MLRVEFMRPRISCGQLTSSATISRMGISLWLVPTAAGIDAIKSVLPRRSSIDHPLAASSYPAILPHITLATVPLKPGVPDMLLDAIPENQQAIRADFQSLAVGDHYFRSVFIDIRPTQELVDLRDQIFVNLRRCGLEPSAPRFPHMSLCYVADEDKSHRDKIAQALRDAGVVSESVDAQSLSLQCGGVRLPGFDGVEIWMTKCDGPVEKWEVDDRKVKLSPNVC